MRSDSILCCLVQRCLDDDRINVERQDGRWTSLYVRDCLLSTRGIKYRDRLRKITPAILHETFEQQSDCVKSTFIFSSHRYTVTRSTKMPATTSYLPPPKPISLYSILDTSNSKSSTPTIDLEWEPFRAHVEAFLNAVSGRSCPCASLKSHGADWVD